MTSRNPGPKPRECGCKGIRSCLICKETLVNKLFQAQSYHRQEEANSSSVSMPLVFEFCPQCKKAWRETELTSGNTSEITPKATSMPLPAICQLSSSELHNYDCMEEESVIKNCSHDSQLMMNFEGVSHVMDFISREEEEYLDRAIAATPFVKSQSGRWKQDFGPKVNFKKQKLRTANFSGLPSYSHFLFERMKQLPELRDFQPVELCNLEYCCSRGSHIDSHQDDSWLWGPRLVTLNMCSDSTLTFTLDSRPGLEVRVPLPQHSLLVVSGPARYEWKHRIDAADVGERRIAMTFRELSSEFSLGGIREQDGSDLLKLALTFQGCAIGS